MTVIIYMQTSIFMYLKNYWLSVSVSRAGQEKMSFKFLFSKICIIIEF